MTNKLAFSALVLAATAAVAAAQGDPTRPVQRRGGRGAMQQPDSTARNRAQLEGQVNDRIGQMARQRLGLNDGQAQKLRQSNTKFAERRRTLMEQERDIRMSLREEMISGDSSHQKQVGDLMDRMVKAQHQRIDLMEQEQKELATFLTPMQRAQYFGLEEQLRRRVDQMRQDGGDGAGGRGRMGGMGRDGMGPPPGGAGMGPDGPPPGGRGRGRIRPPAGTIPPGDLPPT